MQLSYSIKCLIEMLLRGLCSLMGLLKRVILSKDCNGLEKCRFPRLYRFSAVTYITCLLMLLFLQTTKLEKKLTMNILLVQLLVARLLCMLQLLLNVVEVEANKGGIG